MNAMKQKAAATKAVTPARRVANQVIATRSGIMMNQGMTWKSSSAKSSIQDSGCVIGSSTTLSGSLMARKPCSTASVMSRERGIAEQDLLSASSEGNGVSSSGTPGSGAPGATSVPFARASSSAIVIGPSVLPPPHQPPRPIASKNPS